jgi:hypothetical protein
VSNSTFSGNSGGDGGGIFNEGTLTVKNSTFSGNTAGVGVGIFSGNTVASAAVVSNSTFSGNSAFDGGGIFINSSFSGNSALTNVTIANNRCNTSDSGGQGGGIYVSPSANTPLTLNNTIVAGNFNGASGTTADDIGGTVNSASAYNLIGTGGSGGLSNTDGHHNLVKVANPGLAPLGDYGGPTQTVALLPGSPAIDAGSNALAVDATDQPLATDQRGFYRASNSTIDIGAFERQPYLVTTTADSGPGSLRDAINHVNADSNDNLYTSAADPARDEIAFDIPTTDPGYNATTGVFTITPQGGLPTIGVPVVIDGYTQPGASPNTLLGVQIPPPGSPPTTQPQGDNAVLKIQLDLSAVSAAYGTRLRVNADNTTIRGLVVNGMCIDDPAIYVSGAGDHIEGNFIGTDVTGTRVAGNAGFGIDLAGANAVVGGTTPDARNIISGNGTSAPFYDQGGIMDLYGTGDTVQGNFIGTDATGTKALGNGSGLANGQFGEGMIVYRCNDTLSPGIIRQAPMATGKP